MTLAGEAVPLGGMLFGAERTTLQTSTWFVYLVRCGDGSIYAGITTNLARRLQEHNSGPRGARYTRSRRPVTLVYSEVAGSRSQAAQREWQIKRLTVAEKWALIGGR